MICGAGVKFFIKNFTFAVGMPHTTSLRKRKNIRKIVGAIDTRYKHTKY